MKWYRVISVLLIALAGITAKAQEYSDPYTGYLEEVFMDMDYEPNLAGCAKIRQAGRSQLCEESGERYDAPLYN